MQLQEYVPPSPSSPVKKKEEDKALKDGGDGDDIEEAELEAEAGSQSAVAGTESESMAQQRMKKNKASRSGMSSPPPLDNVEGFLCFHSVFFLLLF